MIFRRRTLCAVSLSSLALCASFAATSVMAQSAAGFPTKPITIVVPNPPGGVVDSSARLAADPMARLLGQAVLVDNRGGASGNIAYQMVARAPKDGYTLLASYSAYHVGNPAMFAKLPWDPKDLVPVALIAAATNVITVNPSLPVKDLKSFIAYLKQNPGKVNYASQGNGSLSHVGTELFDQTTQTEMTHVPYKGSGPAIQDVLGGQVEVFITTPPSVIGHLQTGKLRALAVTSKTRHPMLPDVPTTAEAGLPGFELEAWVGLFAPAGTPPDVIAKLSESVKQALAQPETKKRADTLGIEPRYLGPEALAALVAKDTAYWGKIIRERNIRAD
ncbi:MAG: transporter substrate-binding protein [Variovorax sp.]|nr:transporter substrate-binding protein [Variovorax sp.]